MKYDLIKRFGRIVKAHCVLSVSFESYSSSYTREELMADSETRQKMHDARLAYVGKRGIGIANETPRVPSVELFFDACEKLMSKDNRSGENFGGSMAVYTIEEKLAPMDVKHKLYKARVASVMDSMSDEELKVQSGGVPGRFLGKIGASHIPDSSTKQGVQLEDAVGKLAKQLDPEQDSRERIHGLDTYSFGERMLGRIPFVGRQLKNNAYKFRVKKVMRDYKNKKNESRYDFLLE
ncbi:hypothetical protein HOK51_04570 [Candidatus Woesearchaeota archaeon]|jgi:hypothetical protein|nr:hypothetical protein [Candidatus Woesearchaeota archaeon]MBT6519098.1 hypothetical protein [Candidatus Woesearchaeota archaeon]